MNVHQLPLLRYSLSALEPFLSRETLEYHYGRHHRAYVEKLNALVQGTPDQDMSLIEIVLNAGPGPLFNNAAQHWNHSFQWRCLSPDAIPAPRGNLKIRLEEQFGGMDHFKDEFQKAAMEQFGSGYVWLVRVNDSGKLAIQTTSNADNPLRTGGHPLFTCDLWEHAYYIDYRNARDRYLQQIWNVVDWSFIESNYETETMFAAA